ncbi:hypothetical protein ACFLRF_05275 [Candidatus Altiarchaeota archaeon]
MRKLMGGYYREVLLLLASVLLGIIYMELVLRLFFVYESSSPMQNLETALKQSHVPGRGENTTLGVMIRKSPHKDIIYEFRPNLDVFHDGIRIKTNSLGWRDDEFIKEKDRLTVRIAGLGDSDMYGDGIEAGSRYMNRIEELLEEEHPEYDWEAYVFAIPGYDNVQEVAVLETYGMDYEPDLIIYGFNQNDVCPAGFIKRRRHVISMESFIRYYLRRTIHNIQTVYKKKVYNEIHSRGCDYDEMPEGLEHHYGKDNLVRSFRNMMRVGRENGIPVIFFTPRLSVEELKQEGYYVEDDNTTYIDAEPEKQEYLKRYTEDELMLSANSNHYNEIGNKMLAEALVNDLERSGVLDKIMIRKLACE